MFEPAAAQLESEGITMATLDIEAAKEVQTKLVDSEKEREGRECGVAGVCVEGGRWLFQATQ